VKPGAPATIALFMGLVFPAERFSHFERRTLNAERPQTCESLAKFIDSKERIDNRGIQAVTFVNAEKES